MSYLKNTLNFASYSYDASTDTPALAKMKDGTVFEVATAGKVVGTAISGCTLGANSYLLVGDKVVYKNGAYELLSPKIKNGTTINVGAGGLFAKFKDANDYISQRVYTGVILNLLSTTVETSSIDVQNPCGGRLVIMVNGFTIDFSGTVGTNCTLSGNNIYIDDFKVKANYAGAYALINKGQLTHSNGFYVENINVTGLGFINSGDVVANSFGDTTGITGILATDVVDFRAGATSGIVGYMGVGGKLVAYSIDVKGDYRTGYAATCLTSLTPVTAIVVTGAFNNGNCNDLQTSGISCVGFSAGNSCSNYIGGAITTGGGAFNGGGSCSNTIVGAITTGGGQFHAGKSCNNFFNGLVACGVGQLNFGTSTNNIWGAGATGTGGVNAGDGSQNNCNGQPMPAGTPASGTITAAFSRVG